MFLAVLLGSGPGSAAAEPIALKVLRPWPLEANDCAAYREFIARVNEKGKGRVVLEDLGGSEVYPSMQQLEVLKLGKADILFTSAGYIASSYPEPTALMYQFGATPTEVRAAGVLKKLDEIGRATNGVTFLGIPWWANAHVWLKAPVKNLDELKTKKVRSHPAYDPLIKALGIPTVTVSFSEIFTALDRGVLDGSVWIYFDVVTYGLQKVLKYRVDPPLWRAGWVVFLANAKKFDSLPQDVQKLLADTIMEIEKEAPKMYDALAAKESEQLKAAGITTIKLSKADWLEAQRAAWEKGLPEVLLKVSPKYGRELIEMMRQFYPPKEEYKTVGLN